MIESVEVMYFIIIIHYLGTSTKDDEERVSEADAEMWWCQYAGEILVLLYSSHTAALTWPPSTTVPAQTSHLM